MMTMKILPKKIGRRRKIMSNYKKQFTKCLEKHGPPLKRLKVTKLDVHARFTVNKEHFEHVFVMRFI